MTEPPEQRRRPDGLVHPEDDESELVCFCMHVREATLRRAIRLGADSVDTLSYWTAAGMGCGTCRADLQALLETPQPDPETGPEPSPEPSPEPDPT